MRACVPESASAARENSVKRMGKLLAGAAVMSSLKRCRVSQWLLALIVALPPFSSAAPAAAGQSK